MPLPNLISTNIKVIIPILIEANHIWNNFAYAGRPPKTIKYPNPTCIINIFNNHLICLCAFIRFSLLLTLLICSQVAGTCMPPYEWPEKFNTQYDCMVFGYEESLKKMQEIGRTEVNKYNMYVRFTCTPIETI